MIDVSGNYIKNHQGVMYILPIPTNQSQVHFSNHYHDFIPATPISRWLLSDPDNPQTTFDTMKRTLHEYHQRSISSLGGLEAATFGS